MIEVLKWYFKNFLGAPLSPEDTSTIIFKKENFRNLSWFRSCPECGRRVIDCYTAYQDTGVRVVPVHKKDFEARMGIQPPARLPAIRRCEEDHLTMITTTRGKYADVDTVHIFKSNGFFQRQL